MTHVDIVSIDPRDATPIYAQLERGLRAAIATSRLRPGDQLPTVRQLAVESRVNANTVARVYAELERAGVIETRRGVGSFISATPTQAHPPRERDRRLRAFVTRVLADADAAGFTIDDCAERPGRTKKRRNVMAPVIFAGSDGSGVSVPRVNFVAIAILLGSAAVAAFAWRIHGQRAAGRRHPRDRHDPDAGAARRPAVGAGGRAQARPVRRASRARALLGRALRRSRRHVDRSAHDHDQLRRRADAHDRHRTGERRRGALLDGARRARRPRSRCRTTRRR